MTAEVGHEGERSGGRRVSEENVGSGFFTHNVKAVNHSAGTAAARRDGSKQTVTLAVQLCNVLRRKRGRNRKCLSKQQATSR